MIAREARAHFCDHAYFVSNHAHFCTIEAAILMMMNCTHNAVDQVEYIWQLLRHILLILSGQVRNLCYNNTGLRELPKFY